MKSTQTFRLNREKIQDREETKTVSQADRQRQVQVGRQAVRQKDRQTSRQASKQTGNKTYIGSLWMPMVITVCRANWVISEVISWFSCFASFQMICSIRFREKPCTRSEVKHALSQQHILSLLLLLEKERDQQQSKFPIRRKIKL